MTAVYAVLLTFGLAVAAFVGYVVWLLNVLGSESDSDG